MLPPWWKNHLQKNLLRDHDGFHELPYLSNTPDLMFESLSSVPHAVHDKNKQQINTDTPWVKGSIYYAKIEEGLWVASYVAIMRDNVVTIPFYDPECIEEYYFLSYSLFKYQFPLNKNLTDFVELNSATYTFYKPNTPAAGFFYKNTNGKFFNIIFTKDWFSKNVVIGPPDVKAEAIRYLDGKTGLLNFINLLPEAESETEYILSLLKNISEKNQNTGLLKKCVKQIIANFFEIASKEKRLSNKISTHVNDYYKIATSEKIILTNLTVPFLGVDQIARMVHLSATNLKQKFKSVYGYSMLQYHKEKNMLLARQLLQNSQLFISDIASLTGYNSLSKFTAAFKKRFGITASAIKTTRPD